MKLYTIEPETTVQTTESKDKKRKCQFGDGKSMQIEVQNDYWLTATTFPFKSN